MSTIAILIVLCATITAGTAAFQAAPLLLPGNDVSVSTASSFSQSQSTTFTSALYSTPPSSSSRQPRRNLVKRQRRKSREGNSRHSGGGTAAGDAFPWETAESRSIVSTVSKETGEDYWIDQEELNAAQERREALQKREPGQIPNEKLWVEILSPYKQNWIGMISVVIVVLATIVTKFPELVEAPTIVIPDL
jgi:hypothetical protein